MLLTAIIVFFAIKDGHKKQDDVAPAPRPGPKPDPIPVHEFGKILAVTDQTDDGTPTISLVVERNKTTMHAQGRFYPD